MNHKKITAIILSCLITSSTMPNLRVFADSVITNSEVLSQLKASNAKALALAKPLVTNDQTSGSNVIKDVIAPTLKVNSLNYTVNNGNPTLELFVDAFDASGSGHILEVPAVYLNNTTVTPDSVTYNISTGRYDIKITNTLLLNPTCLVQIFVTDEAFNVGTVSFDNTYLIKFDNVTNNTIVGDKNNTITGKLPSNSTCSNLKINNADVPINAGTPASFTSTIVSPGNTITSSYNFTENTLFNVPVQYIANYSSDSLGPIFANIKCNDIAVSDDGTAYLKNKSLTLSGTLSDNYFSSNLVIDTITYKTNGGTLNQVPNINAGFNTSTGKFSYNLKLDNTDTVVTINTHDKFNNKTSFNFNVVVDDTLPTVNCGTLSGSTFTALTEGTYYSSAIAPTFKVHDSHLDTSNSTITIKVIDNSGTTQVLDSFSLKDISKLNTNGDDYTLAKPLNTDGKYQVIVHAVDLSGNASDLTRNFCIDQAIPVVTISDATGKLHNNTTVYAKTITPIITISHGFFSLSDIQNDSTHKYVHIELDGVSLSSRNATQDSTTKDFIITCAPISKEKSSGAPYSLKVTAKSKGGNSSQVITNTIYIDTNAPTIDYVDENNSQVHHNFKDGIDYFNNDVKPKITVSDNLKISQTGINILKNGTPIGSANITSTDDGRTWIYGDLLTANGQYTIKVNATDGAGNPKSYNYVFTIDKTNPVLSSTNIKNITNGTSNQYYYRNTFNPTVNIDETNLDEEASYFNLVYKNSTSTRVKFSQLNGKAGTYSLNNGTNHTLVYNQGEYDLTIHVQDKAGNTLTTGDLTSTFFIQNPATIEFSNITSTYLKSLTPTISITNAFIDKTDLVDAAGRISATLDILDATTNAVKSSTPYILDFSSVDATKGKLIVNGHTAIAENNPGEKYRLNISVLDRAGRDSAEVKLNSNVTFTIDSTKPVLNSIKVGNLDLVDKSYYNSAINPTANVSDVNLDENYSYFDVIYYPNDSTKELGKTETNYYLNDVSKVTLKGNNYTLNNVLQGDGKYVVTLHITDKAANSIDTDGKTYFINKAKTTLNSINIVNKTEAKTGYYNQALIPKIQITDMFLDGTGQDLSKFILSTIKKESGNAIPYALKVTQRVPSKDNPNLFTLFLEGVTPIELPKDSLGENYTLNLKVHHRASDLSQPADIDLSRTFVIDETLPVISSNNIASGKYYRAAFDPSFKVSEKFLNKTDSYISVIKNGTLLSNTKFTSNNITEDGNGGFALKNLIREDGKYEVIVHVEDMAGNASKDFTERFFVDSKIATPSITNIENNRNYNSNIIPIITINDEFLTSEDFAKGDATDAASKKLVYATLNGNPYKLTLNTNAKGVLTIQGEEISANTPRGTLNVLKIYTKDRAAKDNGEPLQTDEKTFVIDKISPTITFKDANNRNIENGGFYQGIVNPVIHFEDNYVIDEKSVSLNGNSYKGKFVTTEDGYTFTGDTITTDGLYTITATGMDKATNKARTFQITFSLDNTKPNIIITGVQDNEFNNKNVTTPLVKVIDTNNLLSTTSFKLTKNGVQVPVKAELGDQGIFNFNVMDEGLYKLNVASTDKAGNSYTTPTLTFTINRTKPIMKFNINNGDYINKAFTPTITTISALDTATVFDLTISGQPINPNKIPLLTANKPYELKAKAKDKAGNISDEVTLNFVLDTISPEINILGLISNFFYNKTITPLVTSKDTNPSTFVMALNNKTYNNETITAEGTYELKLVATDKAKNITQKVLSFVIDKTKPVINIQGVLDGKSYNSIIKPLIDVNDNSVVSVLLDGVDYHGEAIEKDGKHTIIIKAVDKSGNLSETTINFLIKMTPPTIKISGVEDNKTYKLAISPTIILSDDALSDSTIIALDDRAYVSGDIISTEGSHVLKVETRDAVGNAAGKSLKFNINITKSSLSMNLLGDKKVVAASGGSLIGVSLILLMIFKLRKKKLSKKQYHRGN